MRISCNVDKTDSVRMTFLDRLAIVCTALIALVSLAGSSAQGQGRASGDVLIETPHYRVIFSPNAPAFLDPFTGERQYPAATRAKVTKIMNQLLNHSSPKLRRMLDIVESVPEWKSALSAAKVFPLQITFNESIKAESLSAMAAFMNGRAFIYMPGDWQSMKGFDAILLHETAHVVLASLHSVPALYHEFIADFLAAAAYQDGTYFASGLEMPGEDARANMLKQSDRMAKRPYNPELTYSLQCASKHYGRDFTRRYPFHLAYATSDSHLMSCSANSALYEIGQLMGFDTMIQAVLNVIREDPNFVVVSDLNFFMRRVLDNFARWAPVTYGPKAAAIKATLTELGWGPTWDAVHQLNVDVGSITIPVRRGLETRLVTRHLFVVESRSLKAIQSQLFDANRPFADLVVWSDNRAAGSTRVRLDDQILFVLQATPCSLLPLRSSVRIDSFFRMRLTFLNKYKRLEKLDVRLRGEEVPHGCYDLRP